MAVTGYLGVGELKGGRMERDGIIRSEIMKKFKTYICYTTLPPVHMRCDSRRCRGLLPSYSTRARSTTPTAHAPALLLRASLAERRIASRLCSRELITLSPRISVRTHLHLVFIIDFS